MAEGASRGRVRSGRAGPKSHPPRDQNTGACGPSTGESFRESRMRFAGGRGPSAVALGSMEPVGWDADGSFYSGTPLRERIDGVRESIPRWNGSGIPAVGSAWVMAFGLDERW